MSDVSIEATGRNARVSQIHVQSIDLIVAGDAAYNGAHLHLSQSPDHWAG
jgi:hypothetical protein